MVKLKMRGIHRVLLPDYVCETVPDAIKRAGMKILPYSVNENFEIELSDIDYIADNIKNGVVRKISYDRI